ncbi:Fic family protein [Streptomyces sp. NPDC002346]
MEHRTVRPSPHAEPPSAQADAANLPARLGTCLAQATDPALPLNARAARAYLDVCFFHPFEDGNARSAFLTLTYLLAREGIALDQVPRSACAPQGG